MATQRLFIPTIMFILVIFTAMPQYARSNDALDQMKLHFIDVGQGDSMLIETPMNQTILIDGGPPESGEKLLQYLRDRNIREIDLLIVTHPDIDHIGGLIPVMKSIHVKQIIESGKFHTTKTYDDYVETIIKKKIPVKLAQLDDLIRIDPILRIQILNTYDYFKTNNEASIVLHIQYNDVGFLLMGDVEEEQEIALIKKYNLQADILKIAHHGSNTSSSHKFLTAIKPKIALLSYHKNNQFGHPHDEVVKRLLKTNAMIYSTAVYGNIIIYSNGKGFFVLKEKSPLDGLILQSIFLRKYFTKRYNSDII